MRVHWILGALALAACNGTPTGDDTVVPTSDVRIDGTGNGDTSIDSLGLRMCVSENGNVYAVWYDNREGGNDIWFQASLDGGGSWMGEPVLVNPGEGAGVNPDVACIGNTVFVVWEDASDGDLDQHNIYFSRSDSAGVRWLENPIALDGDPTGKYMSIGPRIAARGDEVHVAWADSANGAYDIMVASSTNRGSVFTPGVRVDSDPPGSAFSAFPQLAINGQGRVMVAWEDSRDELNDIYVAVSQDAGATFSPDMRLDTGDDPGSANSFAPRLSMDGDLAAVVWHDERNGANRDVYMNWTIDGGMTWQAEAAQAESDGPGVSDGLFPDVAVGAGVVHVVWQDRRNGGYDIFYRSFTNEGPRAIEMNRTSSEARGEPAEVDGELRLDHTSDKGTANSVNARISRQQDDLAVVWEDRRYDGAASGGEPQGFNELYFLSSEDGGLLWPDDDERVDSFCEGRKFANHAQVRVDNGSVLTAWQDGRRGNVDVMFSRVDFGDAAQPPDEAACSAAAEDEPAAE